MKSDTKKVMLKFAKGAKLLAKHIEKRGCDDIGQHRALFEGKPVCAFGHIVEMAGLLPMALKQHPSGNALYNNDLMRDLGIDLFGPGNGGIHEALNNMSNVNDERSRKPKDLLKCVEEFEKELRERAALEP